MAEPSPANPAPKRPAPETTKPATPQAALPAAEPRPASDLELFLEQWVANEPSKERPLSVCSLVLNDSSGIERKFGAKVCRPILDAIAGKIIVGNGHDAALIKLGDAALSLLLPDLVGNDAVEAIEEIRDQIDAADFQRGTTTARATVTCGVVSITASATLSEVAQQLEMLLKTAPQYPNRTVIEEDGKPAAVTPRSVPRNRLMLTI